MKNGITVNNYNEMLREIIAEVKVTRIVIANRLSTSVTQLYWNIGKRLSCEKLEKGYGGKVVEQLSVDLKCEFPDTDGFSPRSLWDMKRFYEFYTDADQILPQSVAVSINDILQQVVAVLPWGHNRLILSKIKNKEEALYYAEAAIKMGWTRNLLLNFIKADTDHNAKELPKLHNFEVTTTRTFAGTSRRNAKKYIQLRFFGYYTSSQSIRIFFRKSGRDHSRNSWRTGKKKKNLAQRYIIFGSKKRFFAKKSLLS